MNEFKLRTRFDKLTKLFGDLGKFEDYYGNPLDAFCDQCQGNIDTPHVAIVNATDFGRLCVTRHWNFCSDVHFSEWFGTGSNEDFRAISSDPVDFNYTDQGVVLSLIHYAGPEVHEDPMVLRDPVTGRVFHITFGDLILQAWMPSPVALNQWWRTSDRLEAKGYELLYAREAA